jgi:hypothetical protein
VEVDLSMLEEEAVQAPRYLVRHRMQWREIRHTELYTNIKHLVDFWEPRSIVIDATGVGAGLSAFLGRAYPSKTIPFVFSQASKSKLGWDFLAVVETGRFINYCVIDSVSLINSAGIDSGDVGKRPHNSTVTNAVEECVHNSTDTNSVEGKRSFTNVNDSGELPTLPQELQGGQFSTNASMGRNKSHNSTSDVEQIEDRWLGEFERMQIRLQELFWRQVRGCEMTVGAGPGRMLKWGVPEGKRDRETGEVLHDDLLISAALCATLDEKYWGTGRSYVIEHDPLEGFPPVY